jgi:hypothetical protein
MKMDKKKLAAAMAAVTAFIKTGEEAAASQHPAPIQVPQVQVPPAMPSSQMNLWGVAGRQSLMQAGTMMQLRMFK